MQQTVIVWLILLMETPITMKKTNYTKNNLMTILKFLKKCWWRKIAKKNKMSVETVGAVGNYVEFTVKETLIKAKVTMISVDCMQAMCVDTGTRYLFYKTNGLWCLSLQSVSFHKPTQDELNTEKQSYWTKY